MATFLLEVGTEELPASFVGEALAQWRSSIPASLSDQHLAVDTIEYYGTPRRLAIVIAGLPTQQPDQDESIKGPPAQAAFQNGQPTKAAIGFAQKQGVALAALEIRPTDKGEFVFVQKTIVGRPVAEILSELALKWIMGLEGKRFARWGDGELKFSRPIRWLVALLDDQILPVTLSNGSITLTSDRISQGHRVLHPQPVPIVHAAAYGATLRNAYVEVDPSQRRSQIQHQTTTAAESVQGWAVISPSLLEEVTNLVEYPTAIVGKFDPEFLALPTEVVTTEMESHQRYFPVLKSQDSAELLPYFITISNGDPAKSALIAAGNERVIRARLADGRFFYDADRLVPLETYLARLETVTFQEDLGSVRAKVDRLGKIASHIAHQLHLDETEQDLIQRAALLCKADLVTQMVGEFPELQGVMGQKYAIASGEPESVSTAILEHYLPKGAGDRLPQSLTGQVVGLSDRLDTLVSIFSLGMLPTGSSDPFALRRAANAVLNITWTADLALNLHQLLSEIWADVVQTRTIEVSLIAALHDFFLQRLRSLLQDDRAIDYDLVNAVLGENDPEYADRALSDLRDVRDRALFLQALRNNGTLETLYETVNRATRLASQGTLNTQQLDSTIIRPDLFQQSSERAFYEALVDLTPQTQTAQATRDYQKLVESLVQIAPTVSRFFDGDDSVLVMDSNPDVRQNRLNLLGLLRNHARVLADFGAIVKG